MNSNEKLERFLTVLREEIQVLPPVEREKLEQIFDTQGGNVICMALWEHEKSGLLSSPRYKKAAEDLYGASR